MTGAFLPPTAIRTVATPLAPPARAWRAALVSTSVTVPALPRLMRDVVRSLSLNVRLPTFSVADRAVARQAPAGQTTVATTTLVSLPIRIGETASTRGPG